MKIKQILKIGFLLSLFSSVIFAQKTDVSVYSKAMNAYEAKNYEQASKYITKIIEDRGYEISNGALYNAACIYSLNSQYKKAFEILSYLVEKKFYSNLKHIKNDSDLVGLYKFPKWKEIVEKVRLNKETAPARKREKIKTELLKAKELLQKDAGKLWGEKFWNENLLVLDFENNIFSLKKLPKSKTLDSVLYFKKVPANTLSYTNTVQKYAGEEYATVMTNALNDKSATIIHELFHLIQNEKIKLKGNPVEYLDNYDAREWLRLEYQALRNALKAIDEGKEKSEIKIYINDAFLYRKLRQTKYKDYLQDEIEIETSEGLANYTGFVLSTNPNKYKTTIEEINFREISQTFTRPFPYATGPAYGLIFDYLKLDWKKGLDEIYNFSKIYESKYLKKSLAVTNDLIKKANERNNYGAIHKEELDRKILFEKRIKYYKDLLVNKPTLQVSLVNSEYSMSFNMNGTLILKGYGIVYSGIKGTALDGSNFGNFIITPSKAKLGVTGILKSKQNGKTKYTFPLPMKIEGNKITGEFYEIKLNEGWKVRKKNAKGDLEIKKKS